MKKIFLLQGSLLFLISFFPYSALSQQQTGEELRGRLATLRQVGDQMKISVNSIKDTTKREANMRKIKIIQKQVGLLNAATFENAADMEKYSNLVGATLETNISVCNAVKADKKDQFNLAKAKMDAKNTQLYTGLIKKISAKCKEFVGLRAKNKEKKIGEDTTKIQLNLITALNGLNSQWKIQ